MRLVHRFMIPVQGAFQVFCVYGVQAIIDQGGRVHNTTTNVPVMQINMALHKWFYLHI